MGSSRISQGKQNLIQDFALNCSVPLVELPLAVSPVDSPKRRMFKDTTRQQALAEGLPVAPNQFLARWRAAGIHDV